jgi:hypothetical protein
MSAFGRWRWLFWVVLLVGAAWLAVFGDKTPAPTTAQPSASDRAGAPPSIAVVTPLSPPIRASDRIRAVQGPTATLEPLQPRSTLIPLTPAERPVRDIFSAANWAPVAPPAVAPAPAVPMPPPFTFVGKKFEGEQWEVYLARGEQSFIARQGSTIDGNYRIDKIEPPTLTMTQLPQSQTMTIAIGETR